jgi:glycerol kinase
MNCILIKSNFAQASLICGRSVSAIGKLPRWSGCTGNAFSRLSLRANEFLANAHLVTVSFLGKVLYVELFEVDSLQSAATIHEPLQKANIGGDQVAAVGLSGNMIGAWLIDAQGQAVRNGIRWNDARTRALIARLAAEQPGFLSRIFAFDGCVLETGCTLPLIRWLADNEPASLEKARYILWV